MQNGKIKIIKRDERAKTETVTDDKPSKIDFFKIHSKWQREAELAKQLRRQTDCNIFFGMETA